jgi:sterol desaturase/sphingolipid hydroxylase (fatty acid hydroxylase superfamily)
MPRNFQSNRDETIRLFKNPVLEYFSHIHPATPLVVYLPVIAVSLYFGIPGNNFLYIILTFLLGIFLWTLLEYVMHRFAFHSNPKSDIGKKIDFLMHGVHHAYPRDGTRLVMPLIVSAPLAVIFYFLFKAVFGKYYLITFAGLVLGYVCYDSIHYATHHFPMKKGLGKWLKEYHLKHHYVDSTTAFGVSNPLWDYIFGTVPSKEKAVEKQSV